MKKGMFFLSLLILSVLAIPNQAKAEYNITCDRDCEGYDLSSCGNIAVNFTEYLQLNATGDPVPYVKLFPVGSQTMPYTTKLHSGDNFTYRTSFFTTPDLTSAVNIIPDTTDGSTCTINGAEYYEYQNPSFSPSGCFNGARYTIELLSESTTWDNGTCYPPNLFPYEVVCDDSRIKDGIIIPLTSSDGSCTGDKLDGLPTRHNNDDPNYPYNPDILSSDKGYLAYGGGTIINDITTGLQDKIENLCTSYDPNRAGDEQTSGTGSLFPSFILNDLWISYEYYDLVPDCNVTGTTSGGDYFPAGIGTPFDISCNINCDGTNYAWYASRNVENTTCSSMTLGSIRASNLTITDVDIDYDVCQNYDELCDTYGDPYNDTYGDCACASTQQDNGLFCLYPSEPTCYQQCSGNLSELEQEVNETQTAQQITEQGTLQYALDSQDSNTVVTYFTGKATQIFSLFQDEKIWDLFFGVLAIAFFIFLIVATIMILKQ